MRARIGTGITVALAALSLCAAVAVGKAASGGTTTQSTSTYDFPGGGCGNNKDNVRGSKC
jgi:hypothetical protein